MRLYLLSLILVFYASVSSASLDSVNFGRGGGWGSGNQGVLCGTHYCPPGSTCESKHGHYICRPGGLITAPSGGDSGGIWTGGDKHKKDCGGTGCCKEGQYCTKLDGKEQCVYYPDDKGPQCGGSFCREGEICVLEHGVLGCLENPVEDSKANCGLFHCNYNEYCIMVNGYLQCLFSNGTAPFACGLQTCVPPQLCVKVENCQQCVSPPRPDNNCGDKYCDDEHQCVRKGLGYECIPKRLTCETKKCEASQVCIMVNGDAQCIVPPAAAAAEIRINNFRFNRNSVQRNAKPAQQQRSAQHAKPAQHGKPAQHATQQQHAKPAQNAKPVQHNAQQQHAKPAQHAAQQQHAKPAQHVAQQQQQQHAKPAAHTAAKPVQHNAQQQHAKPAAHTAAKPVQHNAAQQHAKPAPMAPNQLLM
nr:prespore gene EB4 [Dictyostelium discoideum]